MDDPGVYSCPLQGLRRFGSLMRRRLHQTALCGMAQKIPLGLPTRYFLVTQQPRSLRIGYNGRSKRLRKAGHAFRERRSTSCRIALQRLSGYSHDPTILQSNTRQLAFANVEQAVEWCDMRCGATFLYVWLFGHGLASWLPPWITLVPSQQHVARRCHRGSEIQTMQNAH